MLRLFFSCSFSLENFSCS